ncbi:MAG: VWA domain-containing protein [Acidobacteria bacterium]|nr:VWA domain-containing protein [Acidobacteriota bacterium]
MRSSHRSSPTPACWRTPTHDPRAPTRPPQCEGATMTFDSDRAGRHHRRQRRFGDVHGHGDTHSRGSDPVGGEGADTDDEPEISQPPPPRPKQLSPLAQRRLQAARLWIAANRPYYSKAVFSCPVIPTAPPGRVGIDDRWRIYANSEFLESLTVKEAAAELIHVLNHALRDHAQRARNSSVDALTVLEWNAAADCEINDDLYEDDLIEDDGWVFPDDLGMSEFMAAEHYYRHLLDNGIPVPVHIECGSGCHSHAVPYELGTDSDALSDLDRALLKRAVAAAVADHQKAHGPGNVPEGLARWAQQTLHPKVDWRQQLAAALRSSVHHKTGMADYTWQRPSRRQQPQDLVLRPAMTRPVPSIVVVVDTSGSMSQQELDRALTEISAIIATVVPGDSVRVLAVDSDVHTDQHIHNAKLIRLAGAGGTNMAAGIEAAAETKPDAIVVITDGWTPWPPTRPAGARCVIAALTDDCRMRDVPDWIQTVDMSGDLI